MVKKKGWQFSKEDIRENFGTYVFWGVIVALLILSFIIIKPYIVALISAFILAYLVKPVYDRIRPVLGKTISATLCVLLVIALIIIPMTLIVGGVARQASNHLNADSLEGLLMKLASLPGFGGFNFENLAQKGAEATLSVFSSAISYVPSIVITIFVTLFAMFYILVRWDDLAVKLKSYIPFKDKEAVSKDISKTTNALIYGTLLVGLVEFVVASFGFYLSGVRAYFLLAAIVFFFAFIPGLGPTLVWLPLGAYYFAVGNLRAMIGVVVTGVILSTVIDAIWRAKVLGDRTRINPILMLVGIFGGITVFGIFGFIIGPMVLAYTLKLIQEGMKHY